MGLSFLAHKPKTRLDRLVPNKLSVNGASVTKPKPKGTKRSDLKRQAILNAAAERFLSQGYSATSMDQVAEQAGVSKQTVYAQFASKEALFVEMVRSLTHPPGDRVQQGMNELPRGNDIGEHLLAYAVRQLQIAGTPLLMQLRRLAIAEAERFPEVGQALYEVGPARAIAGLTASFERWHQQGLLHAPDAAVAATHFNWLIMADPVNRVMLLGSGALPSRAALKRHAREAVRIFLAAFGPAAAKDSRSR